MDKLSIVEWAAIIFMFVMAVSLSAIEIELHALVQNGVGLAMVMPENPRDQS